MKKVTIYITKESVMEEVANTTSYTGFKTPEAQREQFYDRVATVDVDATLLSRFWEEACCSLSDSLKSFISVMDLDEAALTLQLEVSSSYDDTLTSPLQSELRAYISAVVTEQWFKITMPEKAHEWNLEAAKQLSRACRKLYHRTAPVRNRKP